MSRYIRAPPWGWRFSPAIFALRTAQRSIKGWTRWRPRCVNTIRAPTCSGARMRAGRWVGGKPSWPVCAGVRTAPQAVERTAASTAVIHVLAEQGTVDGTSDNPGVLRGFGIMPAESVRRVAQVGQAQAGHGPDRHGPGSGVSAVGRACTEFVQWRDLTCRWPGCDKPAEMSDIDHTVPWPAGPTHASNNKCYCRIHHLIKTFRQLVPISRCPTAPSS